MVWYIDCAHKATLFIAWWAFRCSSPHRYVRHTVSVLITRQVSQSYGAFNHILGDLSLIVNQFESLSAFSAGIDRLGEFLERMNGMSENKTKRAMPRMALGLVTRSFICRVVFFAAVLCQLCVMYAGLFVVGRS